MVWVFWVSVCGVLYAYFGYPVALVWLSRVRPQGLRISDEAPLPSVSILVPAHNEISTIHRKLENTLALDYPRDCLQVVVVSDGSTDGTDAAVQEFADRGIELHRVEPRRGKANALNIGISHCRGEIVVFTDASIVLEPQTLRALIRPFSDPTVGCVSGEDHISGAAGEGLYGRYELFLRNQESRFCSIVGASGSIYAQRRSLCRRFVEGLAPDFLSVLVTVEQRYRAITEREGKGRMTAVSDPAHEFRRKVRTLLRGMSTLWYGRSLLNPFRYGCFAFCLISHKLLRWFVPIFLVACLMSSLALAEEPFYALALSLQMVFYACAVLAWYEVLGMQNSLVGKVPLFFSIANWAVVVAAFKFLGGSRQEIWEPTKRH